MHPAPDYLSGPDFLDNVADAESANGNDVHAAEYRRRADQWRQDIRTIAAAADDITRLQRRLADATHALAA